MIIFVVCTCNYYNTMKPGVTITAMFLALCYHGVSAQTPLDSIRSAFEGQMDETVEEFREYSRSAMDEYNAYVRQAAKDFAEYTQSIQSVWGDEGTALDTPTEWVEYSDDFRSRSIVDFDSGDIIVEVMLADGVTPIHSVEELYRSNQYVSLHIPATAETKKSIGNTQISMMPKNAILINTARKEIIDEPSLAEALRNRPDFRYIADVKPDSADTLAEEFGQRVFFTPKKMGAQTAEANINAGLAAARQVVAFLKDGWNKYQVNK